MRPAAVVVLAVALALVLVACENSFHDCEAPQPAVNGVMQCGEVGEGYTYRVESATCSLSRSEHVETCPVTGSDASCTTDSDCAAIATRARPVAICVYYADGDWCGCNTGCFTDADCPADTVCECAGGLGICRPTRCRTHEDCDDGMRCARNDGSCGEARWACQHPDDECAVYDDCKTRKNNLTCALDEEKGYRACLPLISCPED